MRMAALLASLALVAAAGEADAGGAPMTARLEARRATPIAVRSSAVEAGDRIAARYTAYGQGVSPQVDWSPVAGARGYALALEDPDAAGAAPFVHWLVWNIPPSVTRVAEGRTPAGALQGVNGRGGAGYWGPHPPSGTHRYHLEVFALDAPLALRAGADRDALAAAMRGHVLAKGEITGLVSAPR